MDVSRLKPRYRHRRLSTPSDVRSTHRHRLFWSVRTRILFGYVATLVLILLVSVPAFRYLLFNQVQTRVFGDLVEEMQTFRLLIGTIDPAAEWEDDNDNKEHARKLQHLDNHASTPGHSHLHKPNSVQQLQDFYDAYLASRLPEDEVYLIAFLGDRFYQSSPSALPDPIKRNLDLIKKGTSKEGDNARKQRIPGDDELGDIVYMTEPIVIDGKQAGTFVVAHTTGGELEEASDAVEIVWLMVGGVLVAALILGWIVSGRLLAPLKLLSQTAQLVGESDLTQRIPSQGTGELAELAATFNDMLDRLQAVFVTQRNFISDAGHELRTPITIIRGHLELMGDEEPEEQEKTSRLLLDELDRMTRLVDELSLLAKAERPDFLGLELVNAHTLLKELFAKAQALADRQWQLDDIARVHVVCDRQRITQTVMNLAHNAVQHTQQIDIIHIGSRVSNGQIHIWVRDHGEGIALHDQQQIFERFARATKSRRRSEGSGLGLSIVKAIVEAHHGSVTLDSKLGIGSMFTIVLPLEQPSSPLKQPQS